MAKTKETKLLEKAIIVEKGIKSKISNLNKQYYKQYYKERKKY